ncbi:hypothetical protein AURDEDRAFT_126889 [Auricularia subglabra TFB-10046 SS5]|nr:hypothetical protein AURDEDRAFT_126889 [Auricularia subglabra TFB-10046 SS5]
MFVPQGTLVSALSALVPIAAVPPVQLRQPNCTLSLVPITVSTKNFDLSTGTTPENATVPISGTFDIELKYCLPLVSAPAHTDTLLMLVNGGTYDSVYWDMQIQPDTYSFVRFAANKGYPTLSVTRLGGGGSSRPSDPLGVVQFPLEVAIQEKIMELVHFGGIEAVGRRFEKVVFIGHSMGSILLNGLLAAAPDSLSAAVFTGYSHSPNNIDLKTIANMQPARGVDPSKFGALPAGYWTTATLASRTAAWYGPTGSFDPAVAAYDYATMDVVSEGQWDTWPRLLIAAPDFKGDVLTMNGQNDPVFCAAPDCANIAGEAQFYPNARSVESGE